MNLEKRQNHFILYFWYKLLVPISGSAFLLYGGIVLPDEVMWEVTLTTSGLAALGLHIEGKRVTIMKVTCHRF